MKFKFSQQNLGRSETEFGDQKLSVELNVKTTKNTNTKSLTLDSIAEVKASLYVLTETIRYTVYCKKYFVSRMS